MTKNGTIAVLDIGSSKVVCFIADIDASGKMKISGIGHQISQGVRAGIVIDVKKAENSILAAINAAEKMASESIEDIIINVSGASLKSDIINVETKISGHEVTDSDINHIIQQGYDHFKTQDTEVLHCIPINYTIDDSDGINNPEGMYGEVLSTKLNVITASSTAVRNLTNCLARCHLNVEGYVSSPYASGIACLTEDEKNLGVILLDIGAGNTSIAVFVSGSIVYADSIALGGLHITRDIAQGLSTTIAYAERMKVLYGGVIATNADELKIIDIPLSELQSDIHDEENAKMDTSYISKAFLTSIIKPRVEEMFEMTRGNIENSGFWDISGPRVVLTGGASQLQGVKELAGHVFGKHVRIGKPEVIEGVAESTKGPAFSTCVGMLKYAADLEKSSAGLMEYADNMINSGGINGILRWFKKNF